MFQQNNNCYLTVITSADISHCFFRIKIFASWPTNHDEIGYRTDVKIHVALPLENRGVKNVIDHWAIGF